jgi:type II secretory pathway component PulL
MIGLYLHRDGLRFCCPQAEGWRVYDHELDQNQPWDANWISSAFQLAKADLGLSFSDDYCLLVDRPHAYCTAQSVPFGEKQLPQVLENYLEEELPEDIEDYQFDYRLLHSKGVHSSVLGFWISRRLLEAWCHFADENSLNSLNVQPAELYLLPALDSEPRLTLYKDLHQRIRYSCLVSVEGLPQLTLGLLASGVSQEHALKTLKLQGSHWSLVKELVMDPSFSQLKGLGQQLGIAQESFLEPHAVIDPFCEAAFKNIESGLNFRKGDFAQKGLMDRVVWPMVIVAIALMAWLVSLSFQNFREAEKVKANMAWIKAQKTSVWKRCFPDKRVPESGMAKQMDGYYKEMSGQDTKDDDSDVSSLQVLGRLFSYIKPDDDLQIERVNIGRSISITGIGKSHSHINQTMKEGFAEQKEFEFPQISDQDRGENLRSFSLTTKYIGEEEQK